MSFSSNQILSLTGNLAHHNELEDALSFALKYSGHDNAMKQSEIDRGCKLLYQITDSGKYCIGWGFQEVPEGWQEYPFRFDIDIVSMIIRQYLLDNSEVERGIGDGSYCKGFLMRNIQRSMFEDEIKNSFYGIISFEQYTCYYAK